MEFEKLKKIIAEVLNVDEEEISMETTFVDDLGADSLDVFQIIMGLEEEFDIEIPNEEAEKIVTVGDAVEPRALVVGAVMAQRVALLPRLDEGFLHSILCVGLAPQQAGAVSQQCSGMGMYELF